MESFEALMAFLNMYWEGVLSICAILLTIQQSWLIRKHNRLAVRPMLTLFTHREYYPGTVVLVSTLYNNGLGPASIKSFEYVIDRVPLKVRRSEDVYEAVKATCKYPILDWSFAIFNKGHVMGKESSQQLARVSLIVGDQHLNEEELERYQIRVTYLDGYGEEFAYDSERDNT